ncbi:MAG: hypothetical protein ACRC7O_02890, partial [Fimbriiglobus sp.]
MSIQATPAAARGPVPDIDYTPQMLPEPAHTPAEEATHGNYLNHDYSLLGWLLTVDHKRIGLMYLVGVSMYFVAGAIAV